MFAPKLRARKVQGTKEGSVAIYTVSFTGTRYLRSEHHLSVRKELRKVIPAGLREVDVRFVTGGCWGIDSFVAEELMSLYPTAQHVLVLPDQAFNESVLNLEFDKIIRLPNGGYRRRNKYLVEIADKMVGFPLQPEGFRGQGGGGRGGGTWMTLRMARLKNYLDLKIVILEPPPVPKGKKKA